MIGVMERGLHPPHTSNNAWRDVRPPYNSKVHDRMVFTGYMGDGINVVSNTEESTTCLVSHSEHETNLNLASYAVR